MSPISRTRSIGVFAKALSKPSSSVKNRKDQQQTTIRRPRMRSAMQETIGSRRLSRYLALIPGQQLTRPCSTTRHSRGSLATHSAMDLLIDRLQAGGRPPATVMSRCAWDLP